MIGDYLSPTAFRQPRWLVESAWIEHAPFAFWLIETQQPKVFVELGAYLGYSYAAFCEAIVLNGIAAQCTAIDTWKGDEHAAFYGEEIFNTLSRHHNPLYGGFSRLLRSTFDDALPQFADGSIDLLHIDGRHFYEDVRHDFEAWLPKLSDRAVVLFHDTRVRERDFGVYRLWAEIAPRYPNFEFVHGHGLGVLGVGRNQHPGLAKLFAASSNLTEERDARTVYARLGEALTVKMQVAKDRLVAAAKEKEKAAARR